jgi:flagellar protein FlaJ
MEIKIMHWIGIAIGLIVIGGSFLVYESQWFLFLIGIGVIIISTPFVISVIIENKVADEKEQMFLEFARNLVESVKAGTPVSKSVVNLKNKPYGVLSGNVKKLANQISLGIPFSTAIQIFSKDVNNKAISRSLTLIGQAEKAGGNIGEILEAVAEAVALSDKLDKERKSAIQTLIVQSYIIFVVFLGIILIMQYKIIPLLSNFSGSENIGLGGEVGTTGTASTEALDFSNAFLFLLLIQGFFSGITMGLLSGGKFKTGIKHSFALMILSFIVSSGAKLIFGGTPTTENIVGMILTLI